jgi:hypothetical protein
MGAFGCDSNASGDGGTRHDASSADAGNWWVGGERLIVDPSEATLQGSATSTSTQRFSVTVVYADGHRRDVTSLANYTVQPGTLGTATGGLFTTSNISGGTGQLVVDAGRMSPLRAVANLTVRWTAASVGTMVPADAAMQFARAMPDATMSNAQIVYPNDQTLFPPNIASLEVQWLPPAGAGDLYDLAFTNGITDVHEYVRCTMVGSGCAAPLSATTWRWMSETNRGNAQPLELRVRALLASGAVSSSAPVHLQFAPDDVQGGIYYWSARSGSNGIYRYDFTRGDTAPQAFYTQNDTPTDSLGEQHPCVGCHALSLDGTRIATVLGGAHVCDVVNLEVGTRRTVASKIQRWAQFLSFSPDGAQLLAALDGSLYTLDANTLDRTGTIDTGGLATMPDWSPADNGAAFSRVTQQSDGIRVRHGEIAWLPRTGNSFGAAQTLVAAVGGENRYYPSATPDGRWIVFNRSSCPGGDESNADCDSYDDPTAELWMVDTTLAGHRAVRLDRANARGATDTQDPLTNSWPRVSPFTTTIAGRQVYWLTFSSKRNYGVRLVGQSLPQLWMVAIGVPQGEVQSPLTADPSFAAFWLPFQDIDTGNHIAQWTRTVVPIGAGPLPRSR